MISNIVDTSGQEYVPVPVVDTPVLLPLKAVLAPKKLDEPLLGVGPRFVALDARPSGLCSPDGRSLIESCSRTDSRS